MIKKYIFVIDRLKIHLKKHGASFYDNLYLTDVFEYVY